MKKLNAVGLAIVVLLLLGVAPVYADGEVTLSPHVDAQIGANFDEYDTYGNTYWCGVDPNNDWLPAYTRLAPTDRNDPWRPAYGVIEQGRPSLEFDIQSLLTSNPEGIRSAKLRLRLIRVIHGEGEYPYQSVRVKVGGYTGDGSMDGLDEGADPYNGRSPTLPADFDPSPIRWIGSPLTFSSTSPIDTYYEVDITSFVNSLIVKQSPWAGFNLEVDFSSLPDRSIIGGDTDFGVGFYSNNWGSGIGPQLVVDTRQPEPGTMVANTDEMLADLVASGSLSASAAADLSQLLDSTYKQIDKGNTRAAGNKLQSFINEVESLVKDDLLPSAEGQNLIDAAQAAIEAL
ncbi:MAG: FIMAH domain-containing protein [Chloroflexota bacterium]